MEPYCSLKHKDGELRYLVGTPWVDKDGKRALTKKKTAESCCLWQCSECCKLLCDIEMAPEKSFSFGFIMHKLVVANKVKGFCRDILDSIRHASANDIFRYLKPGP